MFAVVKNHINDVNKGFKREKRLEGKNVTNHIEIGDLNTMDSVSKQPNRDISKWLEDDDL